MYAILPTRFEVCREWRCGSGYAIELSLQSRHGRPDCLSGAIRHFILHPPRATPYSCDRNRDCALRSMLHWLLAEPDRHQERQFWLLFGARREQDIYYREEFETLAAKHANFHFLPTLSRPEADWNGRRGYVQEHLPRSWETVPICTPTICGLAKMVKSEPRLPEEPGLGSFIDPV